TTLTICSGDAVPVLNATSPNGIIGVWNPTIISNTASGSYIFIPNPGQCASNVTLNVTVSSQVVPNFVTALTICNGDVVPVLNVTSPNGITGVWNPATVSNTVSGSYIFTPSVGQCASNVTLNVTVNSLVVPNFATALTICSGDTVPILNVTSPNGITGIWNPATVSNTASGSYIFTPNPGQCASNLTLNVTVSNQVVPNFATTLTICSGDAVPVLNATSPNGIIGVWNPTIISNTASGSYIFIPNPGQCASNVTLNVIVNSLVVPNFATTLSLCNGDAVTVLNVTSPNGITGVWNPAAISNTVSGNYIFTPNPGQCASNVTLNVTVNSLAVPNFATALTICSGDTVPVLNATSPNGITGTWNPAAINNTVSSTYIFTPNTGQCASNMTLNVTINNSIVPNFATSLSICNGSTVPTLNTISPNGISGIWNPATISNTVSGSYVFTPNPGQCASNVTLNVSVGSLTIPDFLTTLSICEGSAVPTLNAISPNGISGIWNPATISNTVSGSYVFTPNPGQCASSVNLLVVVNELPKPILQDQFICIDNTTNQVLNPASLYCGIPNSGYSFSWTLDGNLLPTTTNTHLATEGGNYEVVVTNTATGCTATAHSLVGVSATASATAMVTPDFADNPIVTVLVTGGSGFYQFQMDDGLPQESNQFFNADNGEHDILVTDNNGCTRLLLHITVLNYPHFFTPNGDGYHDFWNIGGLSEQSQSRIYIFDRYGKLLKTLKPSDTSGWDGTFNGNPLPATDYWFTLFYSDKLGFEKEFKSHFSLKR
ncbi:MAG TPA: T9SS type B sorting domain-containing protein, partial [Flavobacterium sp.]|nr:T9SS type B sorting domain-containing protein [Flavobacterium sp.]